MTVTHVFGASANKGTTKRSARDELALRVRILKGRHVLDVIDRAKAEMGDRGQQIGPVDMGSNALRAHSVARAKTHVIPPFVDGLSEDLSRFIGDQSASTTVKKYSKKGGRPMPTRLVKVASDVLLFRVGCNWSATAIGWTDRSKRPYMRLVTPDKLDVKYASDDPLSPTVIGWHRLRDVEGEELHVVDTWDLTNFEEPFFRVMHDDEDITEKALGRTFEGEGYWWRYSDNRPFIPVVIMGDPREPFINIELSDSSLTVNAMYTHVKAGIFDAAYPSRHAIGLHQVGADSDEDSGQSGTETGPEIVHVWEHTNPDKPGQLLQFGPGFDPKAIMEAARMFESRLVSALPMPLQLENTGGEPAETEQRAMTESIVSFFAECRGHDSLVLRRTAAIINRASELDKDMDATSIPERAPGILYAHEIAELFEEDTNGGDGGKPAGETGEPAEEDPES